MGRQGRAGGFGSGRAVGVAVAAGMLVLSGCGSRNPASSAQDNAYLSELHDAAPDIAGLRSDTQLIRLGHAACDGLAAGASYAVLADRMALLEGAHPLPSQDLGAIITSAADTYCPKYRDRVS